MPNHTRQLVSLGDIMSSPEAKTASHPLDVAIGKDIAGRSVFLNLATTPHLLIAGTTGAGKSSGLNCILTSILMRSTPDQVRLILIDPKQVEMGQYNRLPHLLTQPVTNPKKAANALGWAVKEMERRYDLLFEVGFRDIAGYNAAYRPRRTEARAGIGASVRAASLHPRRRRRAQRPDDGRGTRRGGEHHPHRPEGPRRRCAPDRRHAATVGQRHHRRHQGQHSGPRSPTRSTASPTAESSSTNPVQRSWSARATCCCCPATPTSPQRIQGSFVSEEEVRKVVAHWRRQAPEVVYVSGVEGDDDAAGGASMFSSGSGDDDEDDTLMRQAMELVVRSQLGSTSMLQRKLKVGFARAGRIMDLLEQSGVVGPSEGSKARAVLMTVEEFELLQQAAARRLTTVAASTWRYDPGDGRAHGDHDRPALPRGPDRDARRFGDPRRDVRASGSPGSLRTARRRRSPRSPAGPNGAAIGPDGALYLCNNGGCFTPLELGGLLLPGPHDPTRYIGGRIQRVDLASGEVTDLYTECDGRPLRAPNDLVFDAARRLLVHRPRHPRRQARTSDLTSIYYAKADGCQISESGASRRGAERHRPVAGRRHLVLGRDVHRSGLPRTVAAPGELMPAAPLDPSVCLAGLPGYQLLDSLASTATATYASRRWSTVVSPSSRPTARRSSTSPRATC